MSENAIRRSALTLRSRGASGRRRGGSGHGAASVPAPACHDGHVQRMLCRPPPGGWGEGFRKPMAQAPPRRPEVANQPASVEGHVRAMKLMAEQGRPYSDILHQIAAVPGRVAQGCPMGPGRSPGELRARRRRAGQGRCQPQTSAHVASQGLGFQRKLEPPGPGDDPAHWKLLGSLGRFPGPAGWSWERGRDRMWARTGRPRRSSLRRQCPRHPLHRPSPRFELVSGRSPDPAGPASNTGPSKMSRSLSRKETFLTYLQ